MKQGEQDEMLSTMFKCSVMASFPLFLFREKKVMVGGRVKKPGSN
jgi:hypothetical protein